jgi:peptidoglycan/xylan/chitin deacetylase (PgdA/CDA1 family)
MIQTMRATLRSVAGRVYWASPYFLPSLRGRVLILMYHRVIPRSEVDTTFVQPGMYVTPATFERHLQLLTHHFDVLPFADLLAKWDTGRWDDAARYCVITFDDGWLDNYVHAYPLLRAYRLPATIFLPTDLVGTDQWLWSDRLGALLRRRGKGTPDDWDAFIEHAKTLTDGARAHLVADLEAGTGGQALGQRRFVDWNEVREMSRHGVSFASHTGTHVNLTRLAGTALERELRGPLDQLHQQRVNHVPVLAYPNGDHTDAVVAAARAAGYSAAVTTSPGVESSRPADRFRLKRIGVHDDVTQSIPLLALHVARQARSAMPPRSVSEKCELISRRPAPPSENVRNSPVVPPEARLRREP